MYIMKKLICFVLFTAVLLSGCTAPVVSETGSTSSFFTSAFILENEKDKIYEPEEYSVKLDVSEDFLYEDICFEEEYVNSDSSLEFPSAAACFSIDDSKVLYSDKIYEKLYPASITKLLTAYTAVKYSSPDDIITIDEDKCGITIEGASLCGLMAGDRISMRDLLYGLLIYSGNDAANAIAIAVSGSVSEFCKLMNKEAVILGTNATNFVNPHGLQNVNHYTTGYDIYLIFDACLKNPLIKEIMSDSSHVIEITDKDGNIRELKTEPTNMYSNGRAEAPGNVKVICGKTGSTPAAGYCLILYCQNEKGHSFITEIFNASSRNELYENMNRLLELCSEYEPNN